MNIEEAVDDAVVAAAVGVVVDSVAFAWLAETMAALNLHIRSF